MKKVLLGIATVLASYSAMAQVQFKGVSPATVASYGNIDFGVQAKEGGWPGETDDGTWAMSIDFNQPNTFITGELVLVNDGTPGTNGDYGNLLAEEGCFASTANAYAGKIALVRRNTCNFSDKVYYAQQAGAIAVVVINREDALTGMLGGTNGTNDTIPAIIITKTDGEFLLAQMQNGPVTMFLGNKTNSLTNDIGTDKSQALIAPKTSMPTILAQDGSDYSFTPAIQFVNYGTATQNAYASAVIKNPAGTVIYSDTVGPVIIANQDTVAIYEGGTESFSTFSPSTYTVGEYTLTYTLFMEDSTDQDFSDNSFEFTFNITDDIFSYARIDASTSLPKVSSYPKNHTSAYKSCVHFKHQAASRVGVEGLYFALQVDTAGGYDVSNEVVNLYGYTWNSDITFTDTATYVVGSDLIQIANTQFFPDQSYVIGSEVYVPFDQPFVLTDNQSYLFCAQTSSEYASFGYDGGLNFNFDMAVLDTITFPIQIDNTTWYDAGWSGYPSPSIGLKVFPSAELGVAEVDALKANAYPNPTNDKLTIVLSETGNATVHAVDVAGKTVISKNVTNANGQTTIDMNGLQQGVYIFTVTLDNGKTTQFNVVKQ